MNLLVMTTELPYPPMGGALIRNYQFMKELAARHEVTLITYGEPAAPLGRAALSALGVDVQLVPFPRRAGKRLTQFASVFQTRSYRSTMYHSPVMQSAIDRLLAQRRFDAVLVEMSLLSRFDFRDVPVVLDEHNLEYEIPERAAQTERSPLRKGFAYLEMLKLKGELKSFWQRATWCIFPSEREVAIVRTMGVKTVSAVPNGVDLEYFSPSASPVDPQNVVFTGRISYRPNADAVTFFVQEVLPRIHQRRPEVTLTVVGTDVPPEVGRLAGRHVEITGAVPDVRPFLRRASVAIVPIRFGGGTRLKVLEALAMAKPVVSTAVGCEGIDVLPGRHLQVADTADDFADAVLTLLAQPEAGAAMGRRGRSLVEARYGWSRLTSMMESVLIRAAGSALPLGTTTERAPLLTDPKVRA